MREEKVSDKQPSEAWGNRSFPYIPMNERDHKPREKSITEIRGPYYAMTPPTYTKELLEGMGSMQTAISMQVDPLV